MNYYVFMGIILISIISIIILKIINFSKQTKKQQIQKIKEWAIFACFLAEKELGCGTGDLKMRQTYAMFVSNFPTLAKIFTYEQYKSIAETSLKELEKMLEENDDLQNLLEEEVF